MNQPLNGTPGAPNRQQEFVPCGRHGSLIGINTGPSLRTQIVRRRDRGVAPLPNPEEPP